MPGTVRAIGLMSGTSRDGVDAALVRTDGRDALVPEHFVSLAYPAATRERLAAAVGGEADTAPVAREITDVQAAAVARRRAETDAILAFDTGPGNALLDDLVRARTGAACDRDGMLADSGRVDTAALDRLLAHPFFDRPPPKSLDRDAFDPAPVADLPTADAAATLAAFTAETVARALAHMPERPAHWLVAGGGRHNPALMAALRARLGAPVTAVESTGWNGDAIEAEAFAYLAVRSLAGLPLSLPETTGVPTPMTGGVLVRAA